MIPFDPKAVTLLVGPPCCGKTAALIRMAASTVEIPWVSSYEIGTSARAERMRTAGRPSYYDVPSLAIKRAIRGNMSEVSTLFLDAVDQIIDPDFRRSALGQIEDIIRVCREQNTGLVFNLQGSRSGAPPPKDLLILVDHVWIFPKPLTARCVRGPHEGTEITVPPLELAR